METFSKWQEEIRLWTSGELQEAETEDRAVPRPPYVHPPLDSETKRT